MALRNTSSGWGWPARAIHWAMAVLILFMIGLGTYMANFVDDIYQQFALFQLHKSWGFVAFTLALLRVIWRIVNPTPGLPESMGTLERLLARGGHAALYVLLIAMPISGWLMASASTLQDGYGIKNKVFGLFEYPDPFVPGSKELQETFAAIHQWAAWALLALVLVHVLAALRHQFVLRDGLIGRMLRGGPGQPD